jgi:hypothetical protein
MEVQPQRGCARLRSPFRVDNDRTLRNPGVEATLGFETPPFRGAPVHGRSHPGETPARRASSSSSLQRAFSPARAAASSLNRVMSALRS